ncbi:golgin subfamily A member 4 [Boleophthalmus pectinirostris]|uniref:golgin subfamily A member 4 n=1 Tax=Boleophthalmus pectinirostris TaxID=150288 RepID=UPI00242A84DC|nr:golgin subfamily A member 4 [Boleophthalmus pectinirostris]
MFKKLKQRINEEQTPQRSAQSPQQAQRTPGDRRGSLTGSFHDGSPTPRDRETATKESSRSPRGSINGDGSASPQKEEPQSFAQKLQLKVPSVESLIRSGASRAENLFRSSSKDNLVRTSSRESLTPLGENEPLGALSYDPSSDIESEAEEPPGSAESLSKDQLLHRLLQVETSLGKYRGKYSELVTAYRTVQRDKEKTQAILSQSQDKALRRIGELREELQMDQQAKKHLQDEFDAALEEKDQMISVLQTQVALLKKRVKGVSDGALLPEGQVSQSEDSTSAPKSPPNEQEAESEVTEEGGNSDPSKLMEALQKRVKRQENLLQKCKDVMRTHKERSAQLSSENETLQEQLQERLQELEKMKELHTTEKTKLINQLRDAKNHIEQLEQDKGMVIAETKRQMHETLEMKEEEIAQLRSRLQQATAQREELQEQKERAEKSAFEELERALSAAQKADEARKQLQVQLEEQVREVERAGEEERKNLQQELTRVKQEVVNIMKKSSEELVAKMEKDHTEALTAKEEEMNALVNAAVEKCKEEFAQLSKEHEQQATLALEDAELQKTALKNECENKVKEIQLELEATRTRVLELESSMVKGSEEVSDLSGKLSAQLNELKDKNQEQISALERQHHEQLEKHKGTLTQQHSAALEELRQQHSAEIEAILKDKEQQFQAHVEDMNQKTFEKLEAKQTELEVVSSELSEVLKSKQLLEKKLTAAEEEQRLMKQRHDKKYEDQVNKHNAEIKDIKAQHQQSLGGMEKMLKEELNALKIVLREREKENKELSLNVKTLKDESASTLQELNGKVKEVEELQQRLTQTQTESANLKESNVQFSKISEELDQCKKDLINVQQQLEAAKSESEQKDKILQERENELQQCKNELSEKEKSLMADLCGKQEELERLQTQFDKEKAALEKKLNNVKTDLENKLKSQETKMEKFKQKAKEMQESFKKKLQQKDENMKTELEKKDVEIQQKEKLIQEKILEMAQKSSQGLSDAVFDLQVNLNEEMQKVYTAHKKEMEELVRHWQEKMRQQEEDIAEKNSQVLQEKLQELEDLNENLKRGKEENEQVLREITNLKEELAIREITVQKLQAELNEAAIKVEGLSQGEGLLKEQIESAERNLNQALNERNGLQDKLNKAEEEYREALKTLSEQVDQRESQLRALEGSKSKESEDLQLKLEETVALLQAKEAEFQQHLITIANQMERYCQEVQGKLQCASNELCQRVESRTKELSNKLGCSHKKVAHLRNTILTKIDNICTLEESLRQKTEENKNLCITLDQMNAQVKAQADQILALTNDSEAVNNENFRRVEKLTEENRVLSENIKANEVHISNLEGIISDLKNQLAGSIQDKEEAINQINQQYKEERQQATVQMEEVIKRLEQEKTSALDEANTLRKSLSELENNTASKFAQSNNTITTLQNRLEELEKEISEKNDALQRLTVSIDNQSISKSEMDQILSEKEQKVSGLTSELESCNKKLGEIQEQLALKIQECEQLTAELKQQHSITENEKKALVEQLHQTQMQCMQNGNLEQEMMQKLHSLKEDNQKCQLEIQNQKEEFERVKSEIIKSNEENLKATEERLTAESTKKVSDLKKKAEQKIGQIRKQLTSQLEEKEQTIKSLQASLEEATKTETSGRDQVQMLEAKTKSLEDAIEKLKQENEKRLEEFQSQGKADKEKSLDELKNVYEEKMASLQNDTVNKQELQQTEAMLQETQMKLKDLKTQNEALLVEISQLKEDISQKEAQINQQQLAINQNVLSDVMIEREIVCTSLEQTKSIVKNDVENHSEVEDGNSQESLKNHLSQIKNEKDKIHKDFVRLQKEMRTLRKEHEQDLEYMRKEVMEETEKKFKSELEDLELKHNSTVKQLMREFSSQMALKEQELETAVKEAIEKAQAVETELIYSHQEEACQLRKVISQKEDDLHRTVKKYEEVIQSREEEMGDRVWQVQKELEELQAKTRSTDEGEMSNEELQAQLAEKTSLLSEARLKEQEFVEKIHSLEDKIKCFQRNAVVTHLGSTKKEASYNSSEPLSETTEMEYLRKVLFEYMMGRETRTMAKVITSMLKFPPDQAQKVLEKEDGKVMPWLR